ncbi:MAG: translation initiation factor IF-2 subunit gamma [Candidatus Nanoarchaeia archaeon]|nr:translation initiation factor IF-2 subunit gamma [Candidatus Nanoarchaeia archaeon]MDD5740794.1 translation initiation factor IF-2 subunit gamma [Candidatus Nanoarchaeia archaeon]
MKKQETKLMEDVESLEMLNVGMVGHIDHGKTTLLSKLTGKFADTHSEELKRGITIKLGYADTIIEKNGKKRYISFVDCPGHEMLMATMLSGAALIDAAILVIAANEGIKPQTREHLIALKAKKVNQIIIIQNKIDLLTKEQALESYKKIKEFVKGTIAENSLIIPVSAQQNINIDKIKEILLKIPVPKRDLTSKPEFLIARSFDINRPGTRIQELHGGVIAGILKKGVIRIGDEIEIRPGVLEKHQNQIVYMPVKTKIVSVYRGTHPIKQATPGGSLAFETELDNILTKTDFLSGNIASTPDNLPEKSDKIKIRFELFPEVLGEENKMKIESLKPSENIMLSVNTTITVGQIIKIKNNEVEFLLKIPIIPIKGDSIGLARNIHGHWRLIGYGEII